MAKFKKGEVVVIDSGGHHCKKKIGTVEVEVRKGKVPAKKYGIKTTSTTGRNHASYVVRSGKRCYWPLVKYIQAA